MGVEGAKTGDVAEVGLCGAQRLEGEYAGPRHPDLVDHHFGESLNVRVGGRGPNGPQRLQCAVTIAVTSGSARATRSLWVVAPEPRAIAIRVASRLRKGEQVTPEVSVTDQIGRSHLSTGVRWKSSNAKVLSVERDLGTVTAKRVGTAMIEASLGALTAVREVTVTDEVVAQAPPPAPAATPPAATGSALPVATEADFRVRLQECLSAIRGRKADRLAALNGGAASGPNARLEQLLALMRDKDAKFDLLNTDLSRLTKVTGAKAMLDFRLKLQWRKSGALVAAEWVDFRADFAWAGARGR